MGSLNVINGFLWTAFIFIISFIIVFGVKAALDFFGIRFNFKRARKEPPDKQKPPESPKRKRRSQGKTIVIDPDGITRISFKKSSGNSD